LLFGSFGGALAGPIDYTYQWEPNPAKIQSDPFYPPKGPVPPPHAGEGTIHFQDPGKVPATDSTYINEHVWVTSKAPWNYPAHFTNDKYSLSLTIIDGPSGKSGTVTFSGVLNGAAWSGGSNIKSTPLGPPQTLTLGNDVYTITINYFAPPGPPGRKNGGDVNASIDVQAAAPEPATLGLAGLGLALTGVVAWRKRRHLALAI
jgi:hypothetical protein